MSEQDTINLLQECDSGSKMAVSAIDEIMDKVHCPDFKALLKETKEHHAKLGNEIHEELLKHHSQEKDPNPMAKSMAWLKTNMQMGIDESDETAADLMTDGCNMGIKSLSKYLKQVENCNQIATQINNSIDNSDELAQPGSIIFWDSKKNSIIMDIDNIVKKLI